MKVEVKPLTNKYSGTNPRGSFGICLGRRTTTNGWFCWKETYVEYVWCLMGATYSVDCHITCSEDWFWGVVDYFPYNDKFRAEELLKDLKGEDNV